MKHATPPGSPRSSAVSRVAFAVLLLFGCGDDRSSTDTTGGLDETGDPGTTGDASGDGSTGSSGCPAIDPKVGWRAELATYYHGVEGVAEVLDDCTIRISNFSYDGTGLDVRILAGKGGDYAGGVALSDDLLRPGGYTGETLTVVLPEGTSLSDVDGISVWCVDVGIDFGSGTFAPP
jgi:hypothetical protein